MKKLLAPTAVLLFLAACNNPGSDRNDQKVDTETSYPPSGPKEQEHLPDTSINNEVQDSSTTVGYDTSARRKN